MADPQQVDYEDPFMDAHLSRWARRAYWTPHEVAALCLGKDPRLLNRDTLADNPRWPLVFEYLDRMDILERAVLAGLINWRCPPNLAIEYLDSVGIPYPEELKRCVDQVIGITNWKGAFYALLHASQQEKASMEDTIQGYRSALSEARAHSESREEWSERVLAFVDDVLAENRAMSDQLEALESVLEDKQDGGKKPNAANDNEGAEINPKAQNSTDLIISAAVICGYAYDPAAKASKVPKEISEDIARLGWSLTPETVSKHVRSACKRLGIYHRPGSEE